MQNQNNMIEHAPAVQRGSPLFMTVFIADNNIIAIVLSKRTGDSSCHLLIPTDSTGFQLKTIRWMDLLGQSFEQPIHD